MVATHTQPAFLEQSQLLIDRLREFSPLEIGKLMGISDQLAALNATRYRDWQLPLTPDNAKQALLAFNGDVYEGLAATTAGAGRPRLRAASSAHPPPGFTACCDRST